MNAANESGLALCGLKPESTHDKTIGNIGNEVNTKQNNVQ